MVAVAFFGGALGVGVLLIVVSLVIVVFIVMVASMVVVVFLVIVVFFGGAFFPGFLVGFFAIVSWASCWSRIVYRW